MYPHFIEVHNNRNPQMEFMLNVDHINYFYVNEDGVTKIMLSGLRYEEISETYEELKDLIVSAGCHIEKADPRLDAVNHLTMEELRNMAEEPVWNSNTRRWYLVMDDPDEVTVCIMDHKDHVEVYNEDKLIAKPLYRMKVG